MPTPPRNRACRTADALTILVAAASPRKSALAALNANIVSASLQGAFNLLWKARERLSDEGETSNALTNEIDAWLAEG